MSVPKFTHLVLKPCLECTAKCETCSTRKTLHKVKRKEDLLDSEYWKKMFQEINELGTHHLTLSGGEPTLYKPIFELIREAKKYGWEVNLNTNGSLITEDYANKLVDAGLNSISVSVYGSDPEFHDRLRGHKKLWEKAINALRIFVNIRKTRDPNFKVLMQTLICKDNFRKFPELIELAYDLDVCSIAFSYLEGDYTEKKYLLNQEEIKEFREDIVPKAQKIVENNRGERLRGDAIKALSSLYRLNDISLDDYAAGIYREAKSCRIPSYFSIVLANGDVHPCNIVEYTHFPVVGNLHEHSFTELWNGKVWNDFREKGFDLCKYCPVPCQAIIPITRCKNFVGIRTVLNKPGLRKIKPYIRKMLHKYDKIFKRIGLYPK